MDGTLFDTERLLGLEMGGTNQAQALKVFADHYPKLDAKKYFDTVIETVAKWTETDFELLPGTREILDYFKARKVLISVASGSSRRGIERNLQKAGIREYFVSVVGGDEILNGKPAPDIFLKAAEEMKLSVQDCYTE